jgi:periplasmic protein TonB
MRPKPQTVREEVNEEKLGSLRGCLVEGDAEQRHREQKIRRRALAVSIALQSAVLAVLVLVPLFGKTERISAKEWIPIPPYGRPNHQPRGEAKRTDNPPSNPDRRLPYDLSNSRPHPSAGGPITPGNPTNDDPIGPGPVGPPCDGCIPIGNENSGPRPPQPASDPRTKPEILRMTRIDPAMLIHRVEPVYPPLPKQLRRGGRVELRALIGTDGSIQSLQVVAGDPWFIQSAVDAVQQWHYKPTYLNGQAVEVDTYITVVYTLRSN